MITNNSNIDDLVSVIMPAYNCEKYVTDSIKSVLGQTYSKLEIIVIDDGSIDDTVNIIEEFAKKDKRIKFYKNDKNQGVSVTRNRGVSLSNGEWIAYLDSDDIWVKDKIEKQLTIAKKTGVDFIFNGSSFIDEQGEPYEWILHVPEKITYKELLKQNVISCSSVLIKKHYVEKIKMERDDIHEDFGTWLRILKNGTYAYGINEPLLVYRISSNSKSGNKIKSLLMNYNTYRYVGLNPISSLYYLVWYVVRGLRKYGNIKKELINNREL